MSTILEAFEQLDLLDEEYFNLNEDAAEDELEDFVKSDMEMADTADDDIDVIDLDAETEDDLEDTDYIDEIVLECPACHTKIFKHRDEIEGADDSNPDALVNVGEECPQCDQTDGFKIYCQCEPYVPSDTEVEIDGEEVDIEYEDDEDEELDINGAEVEDDTDGTDDEELDESLDTADPDKIGVAVIKMIKAGKLNYNQVKNIAPKLTQDDFNLIKNGKKKCEGKACKNESYKVYKVKNPLNEKFDEVTVKGDGEELEMSQDPETQEITVKSRPRQEVPGEAMVGDIGEEDLADMTGTEPEDEFTEDEFTEDGFGPEDEFTGEEGLEDEFTDEEGIPEDEEDIDIEDVDEEGLNRAVESYFRRTYDNVNSYKTSSIKQINESLLIEGDLEFESGASKKTSFLMEAGSLNKANGKLSLVGSNQQITPGKKAFSITGKMDGNKFMCESFRYNYATKDSSGVSRRINGTTYANK